MTAIDTTVSLTAAQLHGLAGAGVTAVLRYLAPQAWKRLTVAEAALYGPAGMQLVCNWESGAKDLRTLSAASTRRDAALAVEQAQERGYPAGCWLYNSGADFDVTAADWPYLADNLREIRPIYRAGGYGLGMYSSYDALSWAVRDGLVDGLWQSMSTAFSGGRNRSAQAQAHLWQRRGTTVAGIACDVNDILRPAFGQAGLAKGDDVKSLIAQDTAGQLYHCIAGFSHPITAQDAADIRYLAKQGVYDVVQPPAKPDPRDWAPDGTRLGWTAGAFGPVWTAPAAGPSAPGTPADLSGLAAAVADLGETVAALTAATKAGLAAAAAALGD